MRVFDDFERTNPTPALHAEDHFTFLNRVNSRFFGLSRELIEDWFSRYPEAHKPGLRARLRSRDDAQHQAAFWELYLHESLIRMGYQVIVEPQLPGLATSPDFQVLRDGETRFYLEAARVGDSDDNTAATRRRSVVYDVLDGRVRNGNFFLWIDVDSEGDQPPRGRQIATAVDRWLDAQEPDALREVPFDQLPKFSWARDGWTINFTALPKKPESRGKAEHRALGAFGPGHVVIVDTHERVRAALEGKGGKYGTLDAPLVVAVTTSSLFSSTIDDHFSWALFGQEAIEWSVNEDGSAGEDRQVRRRNGFWWGPAGVRYTRVSAVLTAANLDPWRVAKGSPRLWLNPWTTSPLDDDLPWPRTRLELEGEKGKFVTANDGFEPAVFFGLESHWPGPEDLRFEGEQLD